MRQGSHLTVERRLASCTAAWGLRRDPQPPELATSKNHLVLCLDSNGQRVLLKAGPTPDDRAIALEAQVLSAMQGVAALDFQFPRLVAFDSAGGVMGLEWVSDAETLHAYHRRTQSLDLEVGARWGQVLSLLHRYSRADSLNALQALPALTHAEWVIGCFTQPTPNFYAAQTHESVRLIGWVQAVPGALNAMRALLEVGPPECLIHGDARQPNVLRRATGDGFDLMLIDWEMAKWGDPARDLGTVIGEVLLELLDPGNVAPGLSEAAGMAFLRAFKRGYQLESADPERWMRALGWAGEALLRAAYSVSCDFARFDSFVHALARWAVELLLRPETLAERLLGGE